ncbi:MAG: hypothetical protein CFE45_41575, partial [Burkholderiales bacterium PBB5]
FPPVQMDINTAGALGQPPRRGGAAAMLKFGAMVLRLATGRFTGSYRRGPFFDARGEPVAAVQVPPLVEVQAARQAAG